MPRPRKSRLLPSLAIACEELVRQVGAHVEEILDEHRAEVTAELRALRREVAQLARRALRAPQVPSARVGRPRSDRTCSVKGCEQAHVARGLCKNHYQQMRYVEKQAASGHTVRRRRGSSALSALVEATKAAAHPGHSHPAAPPSAPTAPHEAALRSSPIGRAQRA